MKLYNKLLILFFILEIPMLVVNTYKTMVYSNPDTWTNLVEIPIWPAYLGVLASPLAIYALYLVYKEET